jgi:hypothetical protein
VTTLYARVHGLYWPVDTPADSGRVAVPPRGYFVMPCADCPTMLNLADMRDDPSSGNRRRVVCAWCASR